MTTLPFLSLPQALVLLRITIAIMFMAHAAVRVLNGTIPRFPDFLNERGLDSGLALIRMITVFELAGGLALSLGRYTRWVAAGFMAIAAGGIVLIHAQQGWLLVSMARAVWNTA